MEKTKDLKNKQLVKRLIKLSQPNRKDISKTFDVEDKEERTYSSSTKEVDELELDEVIEELEHWLSEGNPKTEMDDEEYDEENVMDFLKNIDFDYYVKLK